MMVGKKEKKKKKERKKKRIIMDPRNRVRRKQKDGWKENRARKRFIEKPRGRKGVSRYVERRGRKEATGEGGTAETQ